MINQTVKIFIVAVLMLMPCITYALPGAHDPVSGNQGFVCNSCHLSGKTIGSTDVQFSSNVCLSCHTSGDPKTQKSFVANDFANPFATTSVPQPSPDQNSHKWFGPDTVPAAGAQAPIDTRSTGLNKTGFGTNLACNRCHSVHGSSGTESVNAPYLRMVNDSDQMCRNCHRSRDTNDHKLGSHPVNVSYTTARNANIAAAVTTKTTFRTAPIANPLNKTGQVKLVNGNVICSTCHGVHNTDSRTSTFDPYSTTHVFGQLSSSKGYLLRVDAYGKTGTDINICSNCHVSKNHNMNSRLGKAPVQCNECHSGHVEYDAAAAGKPAELVPNVNLVRRYLQYTTAGRLSKRILYRSDTTKEYYNATGNGVCQACHNPPVNHYTGSVYTGVFPASGYTTCAGCHNHAEPIGAFSYGTGGSCSNSCHGLPPSATVAPGPLGPVAGYTSFNEANTPHAAHAAGGGANVNDFDCNECHNGYTMPKDDPNLVKEVFKTARALPGISASYTGSNCNNVYCHSTGNGTWKAGMNPISWGSAKGIIIGQATECQSCHDDPNSSAAHVKHVTVGTGMGYGCVTCHAATVSNNTTLLTAAKVVGGTHTNAIKEVQYSQLGAAVGSSCANIKCHSNGKGAAPIITPLWGTPSTGACGACHLNRTIATGSHTVHLGMIGAGTDAYVCGKCHIFVSETDVKHVDGVLDVTTGCATCHASPYSTVSATPTWGTISTGCGQCHSGYGAFTGTGQSPNTGSHTKHMSIPLSLCNQCHDGASAGVTGGTAHGDGDVDVAFVGYKPDVTKHLPGSGYSTCATASCHVSPYGTAPVISPTWGVSAGCVSCHTGSGAFTGTGLAPVTGSHTKHLAVSGTLCSQCHTGASAGISGGSAHIDGNIDVVGGYAPNVTKHTSGSGYKTCASASCHASAYGTAPVTTPTWGVAAGCVTCHAASGAFTGTGLAPVTGSHTKHLAISGALCSQCHTGASAGISGGSAHIDGNIDVIGGYAPNVTKHTSGSGYSTCATASCHASAYGTAPVTTPTWGVAAGCVTCHAAAGAFTGTGLAPVTGSHTKHLAVSGTLCSQCHTGASAGISGGSAHVDGNIDVVGGYAPNVTKHTSGSGYSTCATASCHASPYGTAPVVTPTWGVAGGCVSCHAGAGAFTGTGLAPVTGSHTKHLSVSGTLCSQCHTGASAGISGGSAHIDGNIDVIGGYAPNVTKHNSGSGYSTCATASCHASPYGTAPVATPTWGVAGGCVSCHAGAGAFTGTGLAPVTGSHTKHLAIAGALCSQCHTGASAGISGGSAHIDGNIDVIGGYAPNVTKHTSGSGYSSCATASCHASPYGTAPVVSPTWGVASGCVSCHTGAGAFTGAGTSPTTGSHTRHIAASATCASCHTGATAGLSGGAAHVDGNIDVIGGYPLNVTKHAAGSAFTGTCNTSVCHGTSVASPTWGTSTTFAYCTKCHGTGTTTILTNTVVAPKLPLGTDTGNVSASLKTGAHQTHLLYSNGFSNYSTVDYRCESCHGTLPLANTYTHADSTSSPVGKYKNIANKWGAMTGQTYNSGTGACANTYCHNPAGTGGSLSAGNTGTGIIPVWNNAAYIADGATKTYANCNQCHKVPGNPLFAGYSHSGATDTAYVVNVSCVSCHGHNGDSTGTVAGKRHMDGIKQGGGVLCNDCHGYPPLSAAEFAARGAGFVNATVTANSSHHASHLAPGVTIANLSAPCLPCHPFAGLHDQGLGTVLRTNVQVNDAADMGYRFDSNRSKRYNSTTKTCSNISCHFQPTTAW